MTLRSTLVPSIALAASAVLAACASTPSRDADTLETRAQAFMTAYEHDLRTHDRAGVAARYHADGAWLLGDGDKQLWTHAAITQRYLEKWRGPKSFAWKELTFVPLPPDAVMVLGKFEWQAAEDARPSEYSYSALLRDGPDGLRIAMEDESGAGP